MLQQLRELAQGADKAASIKGLMQALVAGARAPRRAPTGTRLARLRALQPAAARGPRRTANGARPRPRAAGERPEAPQPPGLAVSLHPYQRQSLRFMLDAEGADGGFRGLFWRRLESEGGGAGLWYSPVFMRASLSVRGGARGGVRERAPAARGGCGRGARPRRPRTPPPPPPAGARDALRRLPV